MSRQNIYAFLIQCLNTKIQFWLQYMRPPMLRQHLHKLDKVIHCIRVGTGGDGCVTNSQLNTTEEDVLAKEVVRWHAQIGSWRAHNRQITLVGYVYACHLSHQVWTDKVKYPQGLEHLVEIFGEGSFDEGKEETRIQSFSDSGITRPGRDLQNV